MATVGSQQLHLGADIHDSDIYVDMRLINFDLILYLYCNISFYIKLLSSAVSLCLLSPQYINKLFFLDETYCILNFLFL